MSSKFQSKSSTGNNLGSRGSTFIAGSRLTLPFHYGGLGNLFFQQLSIESDKILQVDTIHNITENKGSVKARGIRLAIEMQARGVGVKDIILISSKTHAHQTIVLLATLFIGAIVCAISPEESYKVCLGLVRKLKPRMCFCDSRTVSQIDRILQTLGMTSDIVNFGNEVSGTIQFVKLFPFKAEPDFKPVFIESPHKEVAFILPTQGTSDSPKLVCISHHTIYIQGVIFMELFETPSKLISFYPLSWVTQTILTCASLEYGVTRIMAASFNERTACKIIHDFGIDVAVLGTELALKLSTNVAVKDYNLNCLKCMLVGVINTSKDDLMLMRKAFPLVKVIQGYCLTETGFVAAVPSSNYSAALEKSSSIGKVLKNCKIKIIDIDTKQPLGYERLGELYLKGDGVMLGYFKDNAGTLETMERGYFKTGDLAMFDEDRWLYLQGRINDMVYINDIKCSPIYLEQCLLTHPFVHDVVIIGNENELIACIEKKPNSVLNTEHIMTYIHNKIPEHQKLFTRIIFFDELPRTTAGNVKKRALREELLQVKIEYTTSLASIGTTHTVQDSSSSRKSLQP